jgi:hypothetical protein
MGSSNSRRSRTITSMSTSSEPEQESHYNILRYLKKKKILRCTESVRLEMF